jgi:hypothetical protein
MGVEETDLVVQGRRGEQWKHVMQWHMIMETRDSVVTTCPTCPSGRSNANTDVRLRGTTHARKERKMFGRCDLIAINA